MKTLVPYQSDTIPCLQSNSTCKKTFHHKHFKSIKHFINSGPLSKRNVILVKLKLHKILYETYKMKQTQTKLL